jgi:cytochrome c peroxidase
MLLATLILAAASAADEPRWPALPRYEAMAVPASNPMTVAKVALGKQLFFDRRLSGDRSTACISCHRPENGLSDGRRRPVGAYGIPSERACPSLWNVGYQQAFFSEGAVKDLEGAVLGVWRFILAPEGPGRDGVKEVAARLGAVPGYRSSFQAVFGAGPDTENVPRALAAFLRTLVSERSTWARYRDGETGALSARARRGLAVFEGKAGCAQCHAGALLTDLQFHNVGIGSRKAKPEPGRFVITKVERDRGAFKTPTLLNVARTAPYFHDGSVATLEEAVALMTGGGIENPSRDAFLRPVMLTAAERRDLLAFLRELTVEADITPPALPE